jgi:GWxTD domain-containing protein
MKKNIFLFGLFCFLFSSHSFSADSIIKGKGIFRVDVDLARFYGDESQIYVELYYGIPENSISYKLDSSRFVGAANLKVEVRNDSAIVAKKEWSVPHVIDDTARLAQGQTMLGIESFALPVGNYKLTVLAYDLLDSSRKDNFTVPFIVKSFSGDKEVISDLEFCTSIRSSTDKKSIFYKNTLEVVPNASRLYGIGLPILYYYAEAYNLVSAVRRTGFIVRTTVTDATGKEVFRQEKAKKRLNNSIVEVGTINLSAMKGGTYFFHLSLVDSINNLLAFSGKKFFVYRPPLPGEASPRAALSGAVNSEYAVMTQSEVDKEFDYARYISSETERDQYERLTDLDAKRNFLYEFWLRRGVDRQTPQNEYKDEYLKRIEYANINLTTGFREGWKTDRGRVYIVYGLSDEIERFPSTSESNPYEIWHYSVIEGGVIFVFVDRDGLGDYSLVHSTHRDELQDPNWYQEYALKMR